MRDGLTLTSTDAKLRCGPDLLSSRADPERDGTAGQGGQRADCPRRHRGWATRLVGHRDHVQPRAIRLLRVRDQLTRITGADIPC
ncbi:hypothetical protein GCM10010121_075040 [Streptomyces brasiliensis]|uniref:Uncharacterized protein n=1 Tax=Streptomyces brasiliensis TaxID=1954 RepID=A0A917L9C2_9ACTN|nr:hypothetical protein GCM10010121_075040 [Streptomyces brasiliensis]